MSVDTIMIVDDDDEIRQNVFEFLTSRNYEVIALADGSDVIETAQTRSVDLVVLDLGLPDINGLELASKLKANGDVGVIILSGLSDTFEKVIGLEVGADDYMAKPFDLRELLARIHSVMRSRKQKFSKATNTAVGTMASKPEYFFDGWSLNTAAREIRSPSGQNIVLSTNDFNLLKVFVDHPQLVLSRSQIIEFTEDNYEPSFERVIDNRVLHLRRKLKQDLSSVNYIKTIRCAGYSFTPDVTFS